MLLTKEIEMTNPTYSQSFAEETKIGPGYVWALVRKPARVVEENFAILRVTTEHPIGEDMLSIESFQLDHMPTGLCSYHGGSFGLASERDCEFFAKALAALPFDWSTDDKEAIDIWMKPRERKDYVRAVMDALKVVDGEELVMPKLADFFVVDPTKQQAKEPNGI